MKEGLRLLKRIISLLVVLVILMTVCTAESMVEIPFSFMGIEWNTEPDEIEKLLGKKPMRQESYDPSVDMTTTLLGLPDTDCLGYEAASLNCIYIDDALVMISCHFEEEPLDGDADKLFDALAILYGEPAKVYDDTNRSLSDMFSGTRTLAEWTPDANTSIVLSLVNQESVFDEEFEPTPYFCSIIISNPPVLEAIQQAMFESWDEPAE